MQPAVCHTIDNQKECFPTNQLHMLIIFCESALLFAPVSAEANFRHSMYCRNRKIQSWENDVNLLSIPGYLPASADMIKVR